MNAKRILLLFLLGYWPVSALAALGISQSPLFVASTEPRIMLLLSRDEQLSIKAYTDYTDLDNDGVLDTTYKDSISYYGYFDSNKCYTYSSSNAYFSPSAAVTSGTHQCGGSSWSGNFLNWASMTRMDIVRKVLFGGDRSTDTTGTSGVTVLERQFLPNDVHSFAKVYTPPATPTAAMPSIQSLTGISGQTSISLCNVSSSTSTTATGLMTTLPNPLIKVASGSWPQWAASEVTECELTGLTGSVNAATQPSSLLGSAYTAKVKVCDTTGGTEANCKTYTNTGTNVQTVKPIGLLQQYSDLDAVKRSRFGLMTGSYNKNKSGGILRKNIALIAGTGTLADEIDQTTGAFIHQYASGSDAGYGIVYTLNQLRIAGFKYTSAGANGSYAGGSSPYCNTYGIAASAIEGTCIDWGNPLSEIYLETIRYFAGLSATTATFGTGDSSYLTGMPASAISWTDPLPSGEWCALCNIVVLSTGINSFDMDQLTSFTPTGGSSVSGVSLTTTVDVLEGINGSYMVGDNGTSTADLLCSGKNISDLALVKGICPDQPGTEGGFGIAGLAYATKTVDLRPGYSSLRQTRWGGVNGANADWAARQPMTTYAVQLAQAMPSFSTPVGTAGSVTILPTCQANNVGGATLTGSGWRNCGLLDVIVDPNVVATSVGSDQTAKTNTCSGNGTTSQCFSVVWEDSQWGNDHDMDGIERLGYCVGSACSTFKMLCPKTGTGGAYATIGPFSDPGTGKVIVAACVIQTSAGNALKFGYTIAGTVNDGVYFPILRPGSSNFYIGAALPSGVTAPTTTVTAVTSTGTAQPTASFTVGNSVGLLKNPLWYVAKYGGFTESTPTAGTPTPGLQSEWDANGDGTPDNYFDVRNPANLVTALGSIFDNASRSDFSAASEAANSTSLRTQGRIYQAKFSNADWSGHLLSYKISVNGALEPTAEWDAGVKINAQDPTTGRVIITEGSTDGVAFSWANLTASQLSSLNLNQDAPATYTDNCSKNRVAYLRGSATDEGANGMFACASPSTSTVSKFRQRTASKLGDIVNSSPWYVGAPSAGYSNVEHPGYSAFQTNMTARKPVVYAGGNDGMLHGFDASLTFTSDHPEGLPTSTSGNELLAYIPTAVFPNLSKLTAPNYNKNHQYFVDGSPMVADIDLDSSSTNNWRTVLIGALGAGGQGYYALDVTDPATFSEGNAANLLLWEFGVADDSDMGYAFNLPPDNSETSQAKQIVKMANGKWAAIVGNGYNSGAGKAVLYVLFIEHGVDGAWASSDYVKLVADAPVSPATNANNGLSTPVPADTNEDGYADTVYAGDLKGHVWKFLVGPNASDTNVTSAPSTWKIAFSSANCTSCTPLFTATGSGGLAQPIISPPEVTQHSKGGQMILFGTGKYLESADNTNTNGQSFYGIWDKHNGSTTLGGRAVELLQQTVTLSTSTLGSIRIPSNTAITNWRTGATGAAANCSAPCTPTYMGWYLDLPTSGERVTGVPKLDSGIIFFNTFIPSELPCDAGGKGWLMALDYEDGSLLGSPIFDTNNDNLFNSSDTLVGGLQIGASLGGSNLIKGSASTSNTSSGNPGVAVSSLIGGQSRIDKLNIPWGPNGRLSWREIFQ